LYGTLAKPVLSCKQDLEQFCENGATFTYNSQIKHLEGKQTYGGYSTSVVVDEKFVLHIPENLMRQQLHRYCVQELPHGLHYVIGT
jgi:D-arabinose 1-dehydrogenase-like Zn-dependent alcohol dehydrogenase